jgi:hypothetical protein
MSVFLYSIAFFIGLFLGVKIPPSQVIFLTKKLFPR